MEKEMISIFWFRRDLRLEDNHGLLQALKSGFKVQPVFIFDESILEKLEDKNDKRVSFIYDALKEINEKLGEYGSSLKVYHGDITEQWERILQDFPVHGIYSNRDYEPYALSRDAKVAKIMKASGVEFKQYKDQCIFEPGEILKADGKPYTVYTPFKNKWLDKLESNIKYLASFNTKKYFNKFNSSNHEILPLESLGFHYNDHGVKRVIKKKVIQSYNQTRDLPYVNGTSLMGIHLRFGTVSVRKCAKLGHLENQVWLSELVWREFFMQIMAHFPKAMKGPFKEKYSKIKWKNSKTDFEKWKNGQTGFPLVDAGMRELKETGHMHNRVRMLVASFLVKDLLIDWRWGEKYFASKLLDFELCSNNGNWQWCAGTGCDAAPYFRIFNPITQQKKFDPDFKYIKKWVKEFGTNDYPTEMIDHNMAYHRAIKTYKEALKE
jgi:deoxyribodipyrimidine photo-lyase